MACKMELVYSLSFLLLSETGLVFSGPGQFASPKDPQWKDLSCPFPVPARVEVTIMIRSPFK